MHPSMDVRAAIDGLFVSYVPVVPRIIPGTLIGESIPWAGLIILLLWLMVLLAEQIHTNKERALIHSLGDCARG